MRADQQYLSTQMDALELQAVSSGRSNGMVDSATIIFQINRLQRLVEDTILIPKACKISVAASNLH